MQHTADPLTYTGIYVTAAEAARNRGRNCLYENYLQGPFLAEAQMPAGIQTAVILPPTKRCTRSNSHSPCYCREPGLPLHQLPHRSNDLRCRSFALPPPLHDKAAAY